MSTRNARQHQLDRAVVKTLREVGGRLVPEDAVVSTVEIKVDFLEPTRAEILDAIRHAETEGRALGVSTETGRKFQITEAGEAWALANRL
jgi:hypothetical protein